MTAGLSSRSGSEKERSPSIFSGASGNRSPFATAIVRCPDRSSPSRSFSGTPAIAIMPGAPLTIRYLAPRSDSTTASVRLVAGSKGTRETLLSCPDDMTPLFFASSKMAISRGSCAETSEAAMAASRRSFSETPGEGRSSWSVSRFSVKVPVLSHRRSSMTAASEMAERRVTRTPFLERTSAERELARVKVGGSATGMADTSRMRTKGIRLAGELPS